MAALEGGRDDQQHLSKEQTSKAVRALLKHIQTKRVDRASATDGRRLLISDDGGDQDTQADVDDIWLILATKKHIQDRKRLKPAKIVLPHSLFSSPTSTVCLITADPQRRFKDIVAHPSFPAPLRSRITRVIGLAKLRAKYKSFESRRQLLREHDVFLADDRVVTLLPQTLGKAFYRTSAKRPVPVIITGSKASREKLPPSERSVCTPSAMANEIARALSAARVNLAPSTSTAIRVAKADWPEEQVVENVEVLVREMVERFVPQRWSNVKSLHIKGPRTTGLPLWMADQLWLADEDVIDDPPPPQDDTVDVADTAARRRRQRKRKLDGHRRSNGPAQTSTPLPTPVADGGDGDAEVEPLIDMARAKRRLKRQKMEVLQSLA